MKKLLFFFLLLPAWCYAQTDGSTNPSPMPLQKGITSYQQINGSDTTTWIFQNGKWFQLVNKARLTSALGTNNYGEFYNNTTGKWGFTTYFGFDGSEFTINKPIFYNATVPYTTGGIKLVVLPGGELSKDSTRYATISDGIDSGLVTTISGSNAITTEGKWLIAGSLYHKNTTTITALEAQDATRYREDVLYATTSNTILLQSGDLDTVYTAPVPPTGTLPIAYIFIPPTGTGVTTGPPAGGYVDRITAQTVGGVKTMLNQLKLNNGIKFNVLPSIVSSNIGTIVLKSDGTTARDSVKYTPESKLYSQVNQNITGDTLNYKARLGADPLHNIAFIQATNSLNGITSSFLVDTNRAYVQYVDANGLDKHIAIGPGETPIAVAASHSGMAFTLPQNYVVGLNVATTGQLDSVAASIAGGAGLTPTNGLQVISGSPDSVGMGGSLTQDTHINFSKYQLFLGDDASDSTFISIEPPSKNIRLRVQGVSSETNYELFPATGSISVASISGRQSIVQVDTSDVAITSANNAGNGYQFAMDQIGARATFTDALNYRGLEYSADYIPNIHTLLDKHMADSLYAAISGGSYVPYTGATTNVVLGSNTLSAQSLFATGTAGNGFIDLISETSPSSISGHLRLYADSLNRLSWKNSTYRRTIKVGRASDMTISMPYRLNPTVADSTDVASTYQPIGTYLTPGSTNAVTNKDLTSGTNTFPTFNQNTTGSAAKWTTARNLAGNSVDGSGNVAFTNKFIVQGTTDAGLSNAQFMGSLGTGLLKNTTTTGVFSIAAAGTDYQVPLTFSTGLINTSNTITFDQTGAYTFTGLNTFNNTLATQNVVPITTGTYTLGTASLIYTTAFVNTIRSSTASVALLFMQGSTNVGRFSATNGNLLIGGTTDNGYKIDAQAAGSAGYLKAGNLSIDASGIPTFALASKIAVTEGTGGRVGSTTLSSGTSAITITGLTTSSRAFVTRTVASGTTLTTGVTAVCTSNTLTITADVAAGTINTADGSTYNYFIIN